MSDEGKDLVDDIESNNFIETDTSSDIDDIDDIDEEESEEIETNSEEVPGPVKHIPPEASWKKRLTLQGGGRKPVVDAEKRCAICGKPETAGKNRFLRGVCRNPCYNHWYSGKVEHPILGKFKKVPRENMPVKKKTDLAEMKSNQVTKSNTPKHGQGKYETDRPAVTDDICLTTTNINLEQYPQIRDAVYRMAVSLSLPVSHVAVTLLAEALGNRKMGER